MPPGRHRARATEFSGVWLVFCLASPENGSYGTNGCVRCFGATLKMAQKVFCLVSPENGWFPLTKDIPSHQFTWNCATWTCGGWVLAWGLISFLGLGPKRTSKGPFCDLAVGEFTTHFRTYFSGDCDVHRRVRGFDHGQFSWVWVKIKPPGIGTQVFLHVSIYQGKPFWVPIFDPQPA